MNPAIAPPPTPSGNRSKWRQFHAGSLKSWHLLPLFVPFLVTAVVISVRIMRSELQSATQRLTTQSASASRNLEFQFESLRDDFRILASTGAFDAYVMDTPNAYWNFAMVRRFVARYQEVLELIELEQENGKVIVLEITPGNYFKAIQKDRIPANTDSRPSVVTHTGNLIRLEESVPSTGKFTPETPNQGIRRVRLQINQNHFFRSGLSSHMIGRSNLWIWTIDEQSNQPSLLSAPQRFMNQSFEVTPPAIAHIQDSLQNGLEGVEDHEILVPTSKKVVSVFTPLLLGDESMGLIFSTDRDIHLSSLHRLTALLSVIFAGSFLMLIGWFTISNRRIRESERLQAAARLQAEAADRAKTEFVAAMSHEIRTPLNGILGYANLLKDSTLTSAQRDHLEVISSSGGHLLSILNDILDLSKISSNNMHIRRELFSPVKCTEEVIEMMSRSAIDQGLELRFTRTDEIPEWVVGDPGRLRQIIYNLVGNGIKFTPKGSVTVTLNASDVTDFFKLDFSVRDTGIGISSEKSELLFAPFSQIDSSNARAYGGTGLGLAICQRLVHMMGGDIGFTSEVGRGTEFHFHIMVGKRENALPPDFHEKTVLVVHSSQRFLKAMCAKLKAMRLHAICVTAGDTIADEIRDFPSVDLALIGWNNNLTKVTDAKTALYNQYGHLPPMIAITTRKPDIPVPHSLFNDFLTRPINGFNLERSITRWLSGPRPHMPERNQAPLRVIVVEDNPVNSQLTAALLQKQGCLTTMADNGQEALEKIRSDCFNLVLMDVEMPGLDGIEATTRIRHGEAGRQNLKLRIVGLSAHAFHEDRKLALDAGMNDYLTKPLDPAELQRVLAETKAACSLQN